MTRNPVLGLRAAASLLLLGLLLGCQQPSPPPPMTARAHLEGDILFVDVYDVPMGRSIEEVALIDPQGNEKRAERLSRRENFAGVPYRSGPNVGVGVFGGSSGGVSTGVSLGYNIFGGGGEERRSQSVEAPLRIDNLALYRNTYRQWRIEVRYLDVNGEGRALLVEPPPPS